MMIPIILGISLIVIVLIDLTPGEPGMQALGFNATQEDIEEFNEVNGLNDPLMVRYIRFIGNALRGDLGISYISKRAVWNEIMIRFPYTLLIVCLSILISLGIGIPFGVYAATHQYTWKDNTAIFIALFCVSMPNFWLALMLVQSFSVKLRILPPSGIETWAGWILPTVSFSLGYAAIIARQVRSDLLEVIRQDYIVTARAKGQTERKVLYRHALKNALIPTILITGAIFGGSLSGAMISEVIFSIPGMGMYTISGLQNRDFPVIQGCVLFLAIIFSVVILLIDIIFAFVDPRIRSQYVAKKKQAGVSSVGNS
jgi:peptide/nickel transport system permease protein